MRAGVHVQSSSVEFKSGSPSATVVADSEMGQQTRAEPSAMPGQSQSHVQGEQPESSSAGEEVDAMDLSTAKARGSESRPHLLELWAKAREERAITDKAIEVMLEKLQMVPSETRHPKEGHRQELQSCADYIEGCPIQEGRLQGEAWQRSPPLCPCRGNPRSRMPTRALTRGEKWGLP